MKLSYNYVAHLDMLGYRDGIRKDEAEMKSRSTDRENYPQFMQKLKEAIRKSFYNLDEFKYKCESVCDNIVIASPEYDKFVDFLNVVKKVVIQFLEVEIYLRGGISYATHFRGTNLTYSHAMVKAYELENRLAVNPRIVIDLDIINMIKSAPSADYYSKLVESDLIYIDNGVYILNILDADNWTYVYQKSRKMFEDCFVDFKPKNAYEDPNGKWNRILSKHIWFENYIFSSQYADENFSTYIPSARSLKSVESGNDI